MNVMPAWPWWLWWYVYCQHNGDSHRSNGDESPGSSSHPAESAEKKADIEEAGRAVVKMLELGLKPSDILTREAFEDAITVTMALGGSTNATLHLLAMLTQLTLI